MKRGRYIAQLSLDLDGLCARVAQVALRLFFFFFQAEDGIRDLIVTGVQTCALPILSHVTSDAQLRPRRCRNRAPHETHAWRGLNTRGADYDCPGVAPVAQVIDLMAALKAALAKGKS